MQEEAQAAVEPEVAVIPMMPVHDRADFCMHSIVDGLLAALEDRVPAKSGRWNRIKAMRAKQEEVINSYKGCLPEEFEGFADNCLSAVTDAINKLIIASNATEKLMFKPNGAQSTTEEKETV